MRSFDYHQPLTLDEALELLSRLDSPQCLAGGQSLLPAMKNRLVAPSDLIKISNLLPRNIRVTSTSVIVGAGLTHAELAISTELTANLPSLLNLAAQVGDPATRHRGTLGGSLVVNDPSGDYQTACLALDACIYTNNRSIAAVDFFLDQFVTALEENEIILEVEFNIPTKAHFLKMSDPAARSPLIGVFVALLNDSPRVAVSGAREKGVFRHEEMERALTSDFSTASLEGVRTEPEGFRTSLQAGPEYRAHLVDTLVARAVSQAASS